MQLNISNCCYLNLTKGVSTKTVKEVTYVMRQMSRAKLPPQLDVKHGTNLIHPVIDLFSFLHTGTAFMVIVPVSWSFGGGNDVIRHKYIVPHV